MQRYKNIYTEDKPNEFVPILHIQKDLNTIKNTPRKNITGNVSVLKSKLK